MPVTGNGVAGGALCLPAPAHADVGPWHLPAVERPGLRSVVCIPVLYVRVRHRHIDCARSVSQVFSNSTVGVSHPLGVRRRLTTGTCGIWSRSSVTRGGRDCSIPGQLSAELWLELALTGLHDLSRGTWPQDISLLELT